MLPNHRHRARGGPAALALAVALAASAAAAPSPAAGSAAAEASPAALRPEERLAQALRFRTVSFQDETQRDDEAFRGLHAWLARAFPRTHATLARETVADWSLLYRWPGRDASLAPILLTAHLDVVPVPEDQLEDWTQPPFEGVIDGGFVWGRGAIDDKAGVIAMLEAVEGLVGEGFVPERTVYLAFGHDEEVGGDRGAAAITDALASRGVEALFSLDEGMAITDGAAVGIDRPLAVIGVAEKGYVTLRLHCHAPGGHSSTPPPESALGCLSRAILRLEENPFPAHLEGVPAATLEAIAPQLPWTARLAIGQRWLFGGMLERRLASQPATDAMLRTTTAVTMAEAGAKENVLPREATATVNFRLVPADDGASVQRRVADLLEGLPLEIEVVRVTEPSPVSSTDSPGWRRVEAAVAAIAPDAVVAPGLVLGGTDSKHYARVARDSYRFTPFRLGTEDLARIHGVDERVAVANYLELVAFYRTLLRADDGS